MKRSILLMIAIIGLSEQLTMHAVDTKKKVLIINTGVFEDITISSGLMNKITLVANNNTRNNPKSAGEFDLTVGGSITITATKGGKTVATETYKRTKPEDTIFDVSVTGAEGRRLIGIEPISEKYDPWRLLTKPEYSYIKEYMPQSSTKKPLSPSNK